jgi:hypothetical protein
MRSSRLWRRSGGIREAGSGRARLIIAHVFRLSAAYFARNPATRSASNRCFQRLT